MSASLERQLAEIFDQVDTSLLGGPLARLLIHFCEEPELVPTWAQEQLGNLAEAELLLMVKATLLLDRLGLGLDASLLADANAVATHERELIERLLAAFGRER